jgi:hypothetical protein
MPTVKKERVCEWFVRVDAKTNEVVARRLAELQMAEESATVEIAEKVSEGKVKKFSAWKVPYAFIADLEKSKSAFEFLRFSVYRRYQGRDFAEPWKFSGKKKSAKVIQAKKDFDASQKKKQRPE